MFSKDMYRNAKSVLVAMTTLGGLGITNLVAAVQPAQVVDAKSIALIDKTLKGYVDSGKIAGISALVYEKDKEVYFNAYGYADRDAKKPMSRDTIVRIFSMTKPITGVALMTLNEQGKFKLDDQLFRYLPEFEKQQVCVGVSDTGAAILAKPIRAISIRDITRHTAGFVWSDNACLGENERAKNLFDFNNTLEQAIKTLAESPLGFHPGEQWHYGPSVDVQARLVEVLANETFDQYLQKNIFSPLKMNTTRYKVKSEDLSRLSSLYRLADDGELTQLPERSKDINTSNHIKLTPGGWGLTSTIDDYARFSRMLANGGELDGARILKPETVRMMASNHLEESVTERMWLPSKGEVGFGIDFAVRVREAKSPADKYGEIGEFFWDGAASTFFWVDPKNHLVAVLFVQLFPFDNINLHKNFKDAVYGIAN